LLQCTTNVVAGNTRRLPSWPSVHELFADRQSGHRDVSRSQWKRRCPMIGAACEGSFSKLTAMVTRARQAKSSNAALMTGGAYAGWAFDEVLNTGIVALRLLNVWAPALLKEALNSLRLVLHSPCPSTPATEAHGLRPCFPAAKTSNQDRVDATGTIIRSATRRVLPASSS
jgi:hypothetical protein